MGISSQRWLFLFETHLHWSHQNRTLHGNGLQCLASEQKDKDKKVNKIKKIRFQYLGEPRVKPPNVVAGLSVCQGYDAKKAMEVRFICFLFEVWNSIIEMMIQSIFSSCSWNGRGLDACTSTLWLKTWSMSPPSWEFQFSWQSFKLYHHSGQSSEDGTTRSSQMTSRKNLALRSDRL